MNEQNDNRPFKRTTCACEDCRRCCKRQPGPLIPGDLERIADFLGEPVNEALRHFCASPGAIVGNRATGEFTRVGTITPKRRHSHCVFLDENERCKIHPVAPFGCAYFDTHMSAAEGNTRALWTVEQQLAPEYQELRKTLPYATGYKPHLR